MGGSHKVAAARDLGNVLFCIINHHAQVIAGRHVFARQNHIAKELRLNDDPLRCAARQFGEK